MKSRILFLLAACTFSFAAVAQVKIGGTVPPAINTDAILELESTTKGMILPRVALTGTANFAPLSAHVQGMTVYNTATASDVTPGIYVNDGTKWLRAGSASSNLKVTTITTNPYTLLADDAILISSVATANIINFPALTLADAGRVVYLTNDNSPGIAAQIVSLPTALPFGSTVNNLRGRLFYWTGTKWLACTL